MNVWIADSGASSHMSKYRNLLVNYQSFDSPVKIHTSDDKLNGTGKGDINVPFFNGNSWYPATLINVLHVPKFNSNLFPIGTVLDRNFKVNMSKHSITVVKDNDIFVTGHRDKGNCFI